MKNQIWVVEYNPYPNKEKDYWRPMYNSPSFGFHLTRKNAVEAVKERIRRTKIDKKYYRVKKYIVLKNIAEV